MYNIQALLHGIILFVQLVQAEQTRGRAASQRQQQHQSATAMALVFKTTVLLQYQHLVPTVILVCKGTAPRQWQEQCHLLPTMVHSTPPLAVTMPLVPKQLVFKGRAPLQ